jgi:large subunit ribosomal protein L10
MPNLIKNKIVGEVKNKLSRANLILLTDYRGMKVKDVQDLKKELAQDEAEYQVVKNTLLRIASEDKPQLKEQFSKLEGPTAVLYCYKDEVSPVKKLMKFMKILELPKIKFAFLHDLFLDELKINQLASLPTREILIVKTVRTISSPLYRLHGSLTYNLNVLINQINQIKNQKQI